MARGNVELTHTYTAGRLHMVPALDAEHRATHHPGQARRVHNGDGQNEVRHAGPKRGDDRYGQQKHRESKYNIQDAHHHLISQATHIAAKKTQRQAAANRQCYRHKGDQQGGATANNQPAEQVAADGVGPQPVRCAWAGQGVGTGLRGVVGRDQGAKESDGDQAGQHQQADRHHGIAAPQWLPLIHSSPVHLPWRKPHPPRH